ncbi:MAG: S6e family ribosomal protein [Nanobdellota archaeon]
MAVKIVIGSKEGKCLQKELESAKPLYGYKIGSNIKGDILELPGYEFEITGGSDKIGTAMRKDVEGARRSKILAVEGVGVKRKAKGAKIRKSVAGNTIGENTSQINLKPLKYGSQPLFEEKKEDEESSESENKEQ